MSSRSSITALTAFLALHLAATMDLEAGSSHENAVTSKRNALSVCTMCQGLADEAGGHPSGRVFAEPGWSNHYLYFHYPNLMLLSESARNGCYFCAFLLRVLSYFEGLRAGPHSWKRELDKAWHEAEGLERKREGTFDIGRDTDEVVRLMENLEITGKHFYFKEALPERLGRIVLSAYCEDSVGIWKEAEKASLRVGLQTRAGDPSELGARIDYRKPPAEPSDSDSFYVPAPDLLSKSYVALVHRWMMTCATKHQQCRTHFGQPPKLPTRVLDISSTPATEEITNVRLVETYGSEGEYACLSYCWGPVAQRSMTTKSNRDRYMKSIPLEKLPETISDALKLCCKLGFRYVWIDSLCIIQDDEEDWNREASRMAGVYSKSALTLAVHLCEKSSESFLQKRQLQKQSEAPALPRDPSEWLSGPASVSDNTTRLAYKDKTTGEERVVHLWAYARNRATRFLFYGWNGTRDTDIKRKTPWLDRAWALQEWLLSPRVLHINEMTMWDCFEGYGNELECRHMIPNPLLRAPSLLGTNKSWCDIVEDYTRRKITKDTDRLPALAGLAEQYKEVTGKEYLAGLWLEDLPAKLLWRGRGDVEPQTNYCAPSWSWASLKGSVRFEANRADQGNKPIASVVSAHCEYFPPGTLSTVTSGWLDLDGRMILVTGCNVKELESEDSGFVVFTDLDAGGYAGWETSLDQSKDCIIEGIGYYQCFLLPTVVNHDHQITMAVLLQEVEEQSGGKDTFRRIGYADTIELDTMEIEGWEKRSIRLI